jgi:hypothetical protein
MRLANDDQQQKSSEGSMTDESKPRPGQAAVASPLPLSPRRKQEIPAAAHHSNVKEQP